MRLLDGITGTMDVDLDELWELVMDNKGLSSSGYGFSSSHVWM